MASYLEKVQAAQNKVYDLYKMLNLFKISKMNGGLVGSQSVVTGMGLSKFNTYLTDSGFVTPASDATATLFDVPMNTRCWDKDNRYGAGIPSDIGFTRNVEVGNPLHEPLYRVTHTNAFERYISVGSTTAVGGKLSCAFINNNYDLGIYLNGVTTAITHSPAPEYWLDNLNTYRYFVIPQANASYLHSFYAIVSVNKNAGGFVLYVTPDFITWNVHEIIPGDCTTAEWTALTGTSATLLVRTESNATIVQNILKKYFRVLPNNNYMIMYPLEMYRGYDKTTMVNIYSPRSGSVLMTIQDPYKTNAEYRNKAINGFSSYLTDNGEIVLYYNNRTETPMVLYNGRVMGTFSGTTTYTKYAREIVECPKVIKLKKAAAGSRSVDYTTVDNIAIDCAVTMLDKTNNANTASKMPCAAVALSFGDVMQTNNDMHDSVSLYIKTKFNMIDNVDVDFSSYIDAVDINSANFRAGQDVLKTSIANTHFYGVIYDNCKHFVNVPDVYTSSDNISFRRTMFGNTMYTSGIKATNNPSLGSVY